jgi:drug/metabolite transporter (DMT)-like permease
MVFFSVALAVVANVLYHVGQRSVPREIHPLASLLVNYGVAIAGTLLLVPFVPSSKPLLGSLRAASWASVVVGLAIVGVELAVLLAYRAGWSVGLLSITIGSALAVLLVPVGLFLFRERPSAANLAGIVLCIAGLVLITRK